MVIVFLILFFTIHATCFNSSVTSTLSVSSLTKGSRRGLSGRSRPRRRSRRGGGRLRLRGRRARARACRSRGSDDPRAPLWTGRPSHPVRSALRSRSCLRRRRGRDCRFPLRTISLPGLFRVGRKGAEDSGRLLPVGFVEHHRRYDAVLILQKSARAFRLDDSQIGQGALSSFWIARSRLLRQQVRSARRSRSCLRRRRGRDVGFRSERFPYLGCSPRGPEGGGRLRTPSTGGLRGSTTADMTRS